MYHPNEQLKQRTTFNEYGKMDGESVSYYSTGNEKGKNIYKKGVYQKDKINDKLFKLYNESQELYKQVNHKGAIKKLDKALELDSSWAEGYFARGTMKLNDFQFDEAIKDFNKTVEIEPYFTNAYSNRAFAILRKHELGNGRTLSKTKDIQIIASKEIEIPESELNKICADLKKAVSFGDDNGMVLEALEKHCKE
jgi:tetratricopeptide (TPR) repeat protein